ncbi:MAG TPA: hypothetical protein VGQ61_09345, partial [Candidatus Angelobacter sp.]|nr:hypothetical protein [Candidatus Angelobacter sp.]
MNKHQPLVDEAALRNTIHQLDLDDLQKDRLINRWLHYVVCGMRAPGPASGNTTHCAVSWSQ